MGKGARLWLPPCAYVGAGCIENLGPEAAGLGRRALIVTGRRSLRESGSLQRLVAILARAGVDARVFEGAPPEPDLEAVDRAREALTGNNCDLVVEAGGGSAIDVGKAAAALARGERPTADYHRGAEARQAGVPHIAVPTTAGTGSEATRNSVLTDPQGGVKKSIRAPGLLPSVCIVDAELTLSCPPHVTAASGMDALSQAVESYLSVHAVPTTEALSLEAARMIAGSLTAVCEDGSDLEARAAMAEAAFMAGVALGSARLGAVHGLAHPVGLFYKQPHGVVCGVLLPEVLALNARAAGAKYERLADAMGGDPVDVSRYLLRRLGLPRTIGPPPAVDRMKAILDYALPSGSSRANPVPVDEGYVRRVLEAVCN